MSKEEERLSSLEKGDTTVSCANDDTSSSGEPRTLKQRVIHSFKRKEIIIPPDVNLDDMDEYQKTNFLLSLQPVKKNALKSRHLQMIAIASSIGSGLFIGSGLSLAMGPGAAVIGFILIGLITFCVIQAGAEMQAFIPISGSFAAHISRFVDSSLGFTISSNYALGWMITFPSELIGVSMTIKYWNSEINPCIWVAIFYTFMVFLNLLGTRAYGESEFYLSIIKVCAVFIFVVIGIVLICGGGPNNTNGYLGAKYWHDPGSFVNPVFKSICSTLVTAAFSFGGCELAIISSETDDKSIAKATKQVLWRVSLFYITTFVVIGCLVPYNDPRLIGGSTSQDITASPFVIALSNTGNFGVQVSHFMNAVILVAVTSVGSSSIFASTKVIQAMGASGQLPSFFGYIDNEGRPLTAIILPAIAGLLGFLVASARQETVFTWLFSICAISSIVCWLGICLAHIRMRMAFAAQGISLDVLPFRAQAGIYGSIFGLVALILVILAEVWISLWPIGRPASAENFFQHCLTLPILVISFVAYKLYNGTLFQKWWIPASEVDITTGRRYGDTDVFLQEAAAGKALLLTKPWYYRWYRVVC